PSIPLIIYGTFTETSIAKLFMAGLIPGIVLTLLFCIYIAIRTWLNPSIAPREEGKSSLAEKWMAARKLTPFIVLIAFVLGGIYGGIFTPTEAAAMGCVI